MKPETFASDLLEHLNSLVPNTKIGEWVYLGETSDFYSTPGGSWEGTIGFDFTNGEYGYILRSSPKRGSEYVALESRNLKSQLSNIKLNDKKCYQTNDEVSRLLESFRMTIGSPVKGDIVRDAFHSLGIETNIISEVTDDSPNWEKLIGDLLEWATNRESVKQLLKSRIQSNSSNIQMIPTEQILNLNKDKGKDMKPYLGTLNQILFGPPGTGKTYHTINKAVQIANPDFSLLQPRDKIKEEFDRLLGTGQIVFTTFHQSMSYEDFIEGIKPEEPQDGDDYVKYSVKPGIFKSLCESAQSKSIVSNNFESAFGSLLKEIEDNKGSLVLESLVRAKEFTIYKNSKGNLTFHANTDKAYQGTIKKEIIEHYLKTGESLDWPSYTKAVAKYLETKHNYSQTEREEKKNYVLIIDEINRGNVSQIFGELITLIEEDKRLGKDEVIRLKLPYSKKEFGVPSNLYIIGTMNTADRSVEALDTALRRRFSFVEMPPQPELLSPQRMYWQLLWDFKDVGWDDEYFEPKEQSFFDLAGAPENLRGDERRDIWDFKMKKEGISEAQIKYFEPFNFSGINLKTLLIKINERIEKLLDKDHLIGHSFFMKVYSMTDLMAAFYDKIIPLLQEYFYGDYGKIGLVLGKGFVRNKFEKKKEQQIFCPFDGYETQDFDDRKVYEIIDYRKDGVTNEEMSFEKAIQIMINPTAHESK